MRRYFTRQWDEIRNSAGEKFSPVTKAVNDARSHVNYETSASFTSILLGFVVLIFGLLTMGGVGLVVYGSVMAATAASAGVSVLFPVLIIIAGLVALGVFGKVTGYLQQRFKEKHFQDLEERVKNNKMLEGYRGPEQGTDPAVVNTNDLDDPAVVNTKDIQVDSSPIIEILDSSDNRPTGSAGVPTVESVTNSRENTPPPSPRVQRVAKDTVFTSPRVPTVESVTNSRENSPSPRPDSNQGLTHVERLDAEKGAKKDTSVYKGPT